MDDLIQAVKERLKSKQLLFEYNQTINQLIGLVDRLEITERQLDEAVKTLEWYGSIKKYKSVHQPTNQIDNDRGYLARTTIKRIKGDSQAEGHQSTESTQAQAGGRIGGSHE
ncbi:hypothetical protein H70357_24705 [Paenibacillus sp. FSL H7-0357]|uniref:hypothetical protein n=1 Tax=Paenibacillus sp. FSL H7-0357 TaxID=1536774 RepID=UPI0004F872E8|nr:hypothetical protein [Paenibacillus sp. FSL H7-0357]AIQ19555.1 hypothetical protein H70357_24705 [Paenibacillus sp. FSL H7-0357]